MPRIILLTLALIAAVGGTYAGLANSSTTGVPYAVQTHDATDVKFKKPLNNTLYCGPSLDVPAGTWRLSYRAVVYSSRLDTGTVDIFATLTTDPTRVTDPDFTYASRDNVGFRKIATATAEKVVTTVSDATYRLCVWQSSGSSWDSLQILGASWSPSVIRAERLG
jgi:hypothetical protein